MGRAYVDHDDIVDFIMREAITQVKEIHPGQNAIFYMAGAEAVLLDALKLVQSESVKFHKAIKEILEGK